MTGNRRDFLRGVAALPTAAAAESPRRQLVLQLGINPPMMFRRGRLIMCFDLWHCAVRGVGGEKALELAGNVLPASTGLRIAEWFHKQAEIEGTYNKDIHPLLLLQDMGGEIPLRRIGDFFTQGDCEIVPYSGDQDEQRS